MPLLFSPFPVNLDPGALEHAALLVISTAALVAAAVSLLIALILARYLERSTPVEIARTVRMVREEMEIFREHWEAFSTALDPEAVTEIVSRHRKRFERAEGRLDTLEVKVRRLEGLIENGRAHDSAPGD